MLWSTLRSLRHSRARMETLSNFTELALVSPVKSGQVFTKSSCSPDFLHSRAYPSLGAAAIQSKFNCFGIRGQAWGSSLTLQRFRSYYYLYRAARFSLRAHARLIFPMVKHFASAALYTSSAWAFVQTQEEALILSFRAHRALGDHSCNSWLLLVWRLGCLSLKVAPRRH